MQYQLRVTDVHQWRSRARMHGFIVMLFMIRIHAGGPAAQARSKGFCLSYINIHEIMIEHIEVLSMHGSAVWLFPLIQSHLPPRGST